MADEILHEQLCQTLARPHHARRIDRLIRRDQNKALSGVRLSLLQLFGIAP
jgi:hypothetical protein